MSRTPQPQRLEAIYQAIQRHPGQRPSFIAQLLGLPRSSITRLLPRLEQEGFYLCEDENGGLWTYQDPPQTS